MSYKTIIYEKKGFVGGITLNRPDSSNTITAQLSHELADVCASITADEEVKVVFIAGVGKHFCLGSSAEESSSDMVKTIIDTLTDIAVNHAESEGIKSIGITGGVSYNIPITEMVEKRVKKVGLKLVVHNNVPNGDGGIAVGQNAIAGHKLSS